MLYNYYVAKLIKCEREKRLGHRSITYDKKTGRKIDQIILPADPKYINCGYYIFKTTGFLINPEYKDVLTGKCYRKLSDEIPTKNEFYIDDREPIISIFEYFKIEKMSKEEIKKLKKALKSLEKIAKCEEIIKKEEKNTFELVKRVGGFKI